MKSAACEFDFIDDENFYLASRIHCIEKQKALESAFVLICFGVFPESQNL